MGALRQPPHRRKVVEVETLAELLEQGGDLSDLAVQDVDLTSLDVDWDVVEVRDTLFLGCTFPAGDVPSKLDARGAVVFPRFADRPYDPYRARLYTPKELAEEIEWEGVSKSRDEHIYDWYDAAGKYLPDVGEALAQRLHDLSIDDALGDLIGETPEDRLTTRIVGIMGGHGIRRDAPAFALAAKVCWELGKDHLIVTGGGPGIMEAGNLGAYLSAEDESALESALATLAPAPDDKHPDYRRLAQEVRDAHPNGRRNLSVPTWFYGFEPSNLFATDIAKYFANSLREDGLLAICLHGIVYADGSAGTVQEIFMDAAQNRYTTFGYRSPMAFLGRERWDPPGGGGIYPALEREAGSGERPYSDLLCLSDSPQEVALHIRNHPPAG